MSTKAATTEMLRRRRDIPEEEVEHLVERAALLQEKDQQATEARATEAEIAAVAAELDIEPRYVEQAIATWREEAKAQPLFPPSERILARRKTMIRAVLVSCALGLAALAGLAWLIL